jgi:hypothetical protein
MPTYAISAPDGNTYQIDGPAGATDDQVRAEVLRQHPNAGAADPAKPKASGNVFADMAGGAVSGIARTFANAADAATGLGMVKHEAQSVLDASQFLANKITGRKDPTPQVPIPTVEAAMEPNLYKPKTMPGRVAERVSPFVLAAAAPGSLPARAANVFAPAVASEAAGAIADHFGAPDAVVRGARVAGGIAGGLAASARFTPQGQSADEMAANIFAKRAGANPEAMAAKAQEMRASGVSPTLVDVTGTPGQRLVKAVGITNDQAGETLQNNAQVVSSTTKPAAMARTRTLSGEKRTATQLSADLEKARQTEAQTRYAEPYAAPIKLDDPSVIQALRDPEGASAINRAITAARARMDSGAVADLQALKATANGPTGEGQVWPTTGRALDRVQIAFGNKARALSQNGASDIASGLLMRRERINGLLDNVPGLTEARAAFKAKSQAIDILDGDHKDPFSTDPADYADWLKGLSPEARHANQVAIRQDVLDTLGGQRASTVGSLDELATSPYARQNLQAALGEHEAGGYLANLTARLAQKRNASQVSPYAGSPTTMLRNDTSGLDRAASLADTAVKVKTGNVLGLAAKLSAYLKTRGLNDQQAQDFAKAAVDPARVDGVIAALGRLKGPREAREFVNFRGGLLGVARGSVPFGSPPAPAPQ